MEEYAVEMLEAQSKILARVPPTSVPTNERQKADIDNELMSLLCLHSPQQRSILEIAATGDWS